MPVMVFLSYNFADEAFAESLARHLLTQYPDVDTYFYKYNRRADEWNKQLRAALKGASHCLAILGKTLGKTQKKEMVRATTRRGPP